MDDCTEKDCKWRLQVAPIRPEAQEVSLSALLYQHSKWTPEPGFVVGCDSGGQGRKKTVIFTMWDPKEPAILTKLSVPWRHGIVGENEPGIVYTLAPRTIAILPSSCTILVNAVHADADMNCATSDMNFADMFRFISHFVVRRSLSSPFSITISEALVAVQENFFLGTRWGNSLQLAPPKNVAEISVLLATRACVDDAISTPTSSRKSSRSSRASGHSSSLRVATSESGKGIPQVGYGCSKALDVDNDTHVQPCLIVLPDTQSPVPLKPRTPITLISSAKPQDCACFRR